MGVIAAAIAAMPAVGAPQATECQMKSAYVEFVISNRQGGLAESQIPDLYGAQLDRSWKQRARHAIYSDANLALADPMRAAEQVYRACQAETPSTPPDYKGVFSMPHPR